MEYGNSLFRVVLIFIATLSGCGSMFSKNKTKFDWLVTETAPRNYPMKIIDGTFYYHNEKGGLYVPTASSIYPGWGKGVSTHVVGEDYKALPDRLDIRFYSYTEDKMYHGSFDLPYEKILSWFKAGEEKNRDIEHPTFDTIMVGVAPGGAVAVWVSGAETREVFFGQAEQYEGDLPNSLGNIVKDREEFSRRVMQGAGIAPELLADIRKNGPPIGKWAEYRKQYLWEPKFVRAQLPKRVNVSLYNGESYSLSMPLSEQDKAKSRAVPLLFSFGYLIEGETEQDPFTVRFDEAEIYAAFAQLGANQENVIIEFEPRLPKNLTTVRMYNSKESIQLKKVSVDK